MNNTVHILFVAAILSLVTFSSCTTVSTTQYRNDGFTEWLPWGEFREFLAEKEKKDQNYKNFWDKGHWILAAEGLWKDGQAQFRIKIGDVPKNKAILWMWYTNLEQKDFDKLIEKFTVDGYTLVYCNSYARPSGTILYQAVWHNMNPKKKTAPNKAPESITSQSAPQSIFSPWMESDQYQAYFNTRKPRSYPAVVEGTLISGTPFYRAIFVPFPSSGFNFWTHHGLRDEEFARRNQELQAQGYTLITKQAFVEQDGTARIQGTWIKRPMD